MWKTHLSPGWMNNHLKWRTGFDSMVVGSSRGWGGFLPFTYLFNIFFNDWSKWGGESVTYRGLPISTVPVAAFWLTPSQGRSRSVVNGVSRHRPLATSSSSRSNRFVSVDRLVDGGGLWFANNLHTYENMGFLRIFCRFLPFLRNFWRFWFEKEDFFVIFFIF